MSRPALLALALAALAAPAAAPAGPVQTLAYAKGKIAAFAQDGGRIAWASVDPPGSPCPWRVRVRTLATGLQVVINSPTGPTCRHEVGFQLPGEVSLALAGSRALWTTTDSGNFRYVQVYTASLENRRDRRLEELVYRYAFDDGWHLGGLAGDGATLLFGRYETRVVVVGDCEERGTCASEVSDGGAQRVVGRSAVAIAGAPPTQLVATSSGRVALVRAVISGATTVEIRNASTGALVTSFAPAEPVLAVALSGQAAAVLVQAGGGKRIERYGAATGAFLSSKPVPGATAPELSLAGTRIVFRTGNRIRLLDTATGATSVLAVSPSRPLGLSIEGNRVAWAANVGPKGRVLAVFLP